MYVRFDASLPLPDVDRLSRRYSFILQIKYHIPSQATLRLGIMINYHPDAELLVQHLPTDDVHWYSVRFCS